MMAFYSDSFSPLLPLIFSSYAAAAIRHAEAADAAIMMIAAARRCWR